MATTARNNGGKSSSARPPRNRTAESTRVRLSDATKKALLDGAMRSMVATMDSPEFKGILRQAARDEMHRVLNREVGGSPNDYHATAEGLRPGLHAKAEADPPRVDRNVAVASRPFVRGTIEQLEEQNKSLSVSLARLTVIADRLFGCEPRATANEDKDRVEPSNDRDIIGLLLLDSENLAREVSHQIDRLDNQL